MALCFGEPVQLANFKESRLQKQVIQLIPNINHRESCGQVFLQLKILTLPCLYTWETALFCLFKCALTQRRS